MELASNFCSRVRLVDGSPARDYTSRVNVGITSMPANPTLEFRLRATIGFGDMATLGTFTAGITCVDGYNQNAPDLGLVFNKRSQLPERPVMQFSSLLTSSPDPRANTFQVFDGDSAICALRFVNDLLADRVVEILREVRFLASALLQKSSGRFRPFALESGSKLSVSFSQIANMRSRKTLSVRVGSDAGDSEIHSEKTIRFVGWWLNGVDRGEKKPPAFAQDKVRFALSRPKQLALLFPASKGNVLTALGSPDRNRPLFVFQNPVVEGDGAVFTENALLVPVQFIGVRDLRDQANDDLSRKAVLLADSLIGELVNLELAESFTLPSKARDFIGRSVGQFKRFAKSRGLLQIGFEFKANGQSHITMISRIFLYLKKMIVSKTRRSQNFSPLRLTEMLAMDGVLSRF